MKHTTHEYSPRHAPVIDNTRVRGIQLVWFPDAVQDDITWAREFSIVPSPEVRLTFR